MLCKNKEDEYITVVLSNATSIQGEYIYFIPNKPIYKEEEITYCLKIKLSHFINTLIEKKLLVTLFNGGLSILEFKLNITNGNIDIVSVKESI